MTVARINEFSAAPGQADQLFARLSSFAGVIRSTDGCVDVSVLRSHEDPERIVIYEVWESVDHHRAAADAIPAEAVNETVALLNGPPRGEYFDLS